MTQVKEVMKSLGYRLFIFVPEMKEIRDEQV